LSFYGDIAECLVFDRILKKDEALKIETYLAIKYGITLIESNYLSSSDVVLWNYEENKDYSNSIAGLGQDSIFGLSQKQGSSTEEEDLLTVWVGDFFQENNDNTYLLSEKNYLLWGHDNTALTYSDLSCEVSYPMLERKWLLQATYTNKNTFSTKVKFRMPADYIDTLRVCYLTIDRSGNGNFVSKDVEYIVQDSIDSFGNVYFSDVVWDKDGSGKDVFSFSYGAVLDLEPTASCPNISNGSLLVNVCGGESLFDYFLENDSTGQQFSYYGDRGYNFEGLSAGFYTLRLTDDNNNVISKRVEIQCYSPEEASINGCDTLVDINDNSSVLSDKRKGIERKNIEDDALENVSDKYYQLYPNPSSGQYRIEASFPSETFIYVRVYTTHGSLVNEFKREGSSHYVFDNYISTQGSYMIEIETFYGIKEFKLTVVK